MPRSGIAGPYVSSFFSFLEETPYGFLQWLHQLTLPPTVKEDYFLSTSSPASIICRLFNDGHFDWCEVVSHCGFSSLAALDLFCRSWASLVVVCGLQQWFLEKCAPILQGPGRCTVWGCEWSYLKLSCPHSLSFSATLVLFFISFFIRICSLWSFGHLSAVTKTLSSFSD